MNEKEDIRAIWNLSHAAESYECDTMKNGLYLAQRLKEYEDESPHKPPFALNYLEYYNSPEPVTSWIIRHIFAYKYECHHPFFESFAQTFLRRIGFDTDWIDTPIVDKDHEYKGIDILVRDKRYAIIIENKLKGAAFQLNQLARYIATMRQAGYADDQIFMVVLPMDEDVESHIPGSVWRLPADWQSVNQVRKCRVDSHGCRCDMADYIPKAYCNKCEPLKEKYKDRLLFIREELSEWLYGCMVDNTACLPEGEFDKQYVLRSAALQFVDFLNYLYQTRENNKYKMDIKNFLSNELELNNYDIVEQLSVIGEKKKQVEELVQQLNELYNCKLKEYIDYIGKKHQIHLVREDDEWYFHYKVKVEGKTLMVSVNVEKNYYCQLETVGQKRIPDFILNDFEITEELNDEDNTTTCIWRYDTYDESLQRFDRVIGRVLELIAANCKSK